MSEAKEPKKGKQPKEGAKEGKGGGKEGQQQPKQGKQGKSEGKGGEWRKPSKSSTRLHAFLPMPNHWRKRRPASFNCCWMDCVLN